MEVLSAKEETGDSELSRRIRSVQETLNQHADGLTLKYEFHFIDKIYGIILNAKRYRELVTTQRQLLSLLQVVTDCIESATHSI